MKPSTLAATVLAVATLAGCDPVGDDVVGPEGGVVVSEDGRLTIEIPEGALTDAVEITVEMVDDEPGRALGPAYRVEPVGLVFEEPVQVLYHYGADGMQVDPADVALVVERTDGWSELADRHVFEDEAIVSASALYLSTFCVIERQG